MTVDFLRLAYRQVKRSGPRSVAGIGAAALATVILVLGRLVPGGDFRFAAAAERSYAEGDILVWTAPPHVWADDDGPLELVSWNGEPWQSYAEYFIPSLPQDGYLAPPGSVDWGPLDLDRVSAMIMEVPGVTGMVPYLACPCVLLTEEGTFPAILRGMAVPEVLGIGASWADYEDPQAALLPSRCLPSSPGAQVKVGLPEHGREMGTVDPDSAAVVTLQCVGGYEVLLGVVPGTEPPEGPPEELRYWDRPEILVSPETFVELCGDVPVHQMAVRVERQTIVKAVVADLRSALGSGYTAYSVVELSHIRDRGGGQQLVVRDTSGLVITMFHAMAASVVVGSTYVTLAMERRKIGLLRAIGATSWDIAVYTLAVAGIVSGTGAAIGFVSGKALSLLMLPAIDLTLPGWLSQSAYDAFLCLLGPAMALGMGLLVAVWAARIPSAEVMRRE